MSDPRDMEMLADQEHDSWAKWTRWMLSKISEELDSAAENGKKPIYYDALLALNQTECVQRWRRQMDATYTELSEREKESDRKVVREKLALYRPEGAINDNDKKVLENLRKCLSVTIGAGGDVSAVMLNELVKACGLELEAV